MKRNGKRNWQRVLTAAAACAVSLAMLAACSGARRTKDLAQPERAGSILLSVNPEIEIDYDHEGKVLELEAKNDDGQKLISHYRNFSGKSAETVVDDLLQLIYQEGFFSRQIAGHDKNIILKTSKDSVYPTEDFLDKIVQSVRETVAMLGLAAAPMSVEAKDLDASGYIKPEKARELFLAQLGLDETQLKNTEMTFRAGVYEIEFTKDGISYEFELNAQNGKVLEADADLNLDGTAAAVPEVKDDVDDPDDKDDVDEPDDKDDVDDLDDKDAADDPDDKDDADDLDDKDDADDLDDKDDIDETDDKDDVDEPDDKEDADDFDEKDDVDDLDDKDDIDEPDDKDDADDLDDKDDIDEPDDKDDVDDLDDKDDVDHKSAAAKKPAAVSATTAVVQADDDDDYAETEDEDDRDEPDEADTKDDADDDDQDDDQDDANDDVEDEPDEDDKD